MIPNLVAALLLALSSLGFLTFQTSSPELVYVALGDSVAAGIGSSLPRERSYPPLLGDLVAGHLDRLIRVENLARPGESAETFLSGEQPGELERLIADVESSGAELQVVTVSLGGNEVLDLRDASREQRQAALERFTTSYPEALAAVRDIVGESVPLLASTVYDPTGGDAAIEFSDSWWIEQFNSVVRDAAPLSDVVTVDLASELGDSATQLTRYPVDIHPTNEGHARIAATHWAAMGIDVEPPELEVLSSGSSSRYTPTVRFRVSEAIAPDSLAIDASDHATVIYPPVQVAVREFVVLVDASESRPDDLTLTISAADLAGNRTETDVALEFTARR